MLVPPLGRVDGSGRSLKRERWPDGAVQASGSSLLLRGGVRAAVTPGALALVPRLEPKLGLGLGAGEESWSSFGSSSIRWSVAAW